MSTLKSFALTSAVLLAAALSQPAAAQTFVPRTDAPLATDNGPDQVQRDYNNYYHIPGYNAFGQGEIGTYPGVVVPPQSGIGGYAPAYPSYNLPYPDKPYGDPDRD